MSGSSTTASVSLMMSSTTECVLRSKFSSLLSLMSSVRLLCCFSFSGWNLLRLLTISDGIMAAFSDWNLPRLPAIAGSIVASSSFPSTLEMNMTVKQTGLNDGIISVRHAPREQQVHTLPSLTSEDGYGKNMHAMHMIWMGRGEGGETYRAWRQTDRQTDRKGQTDKQTRTEIQIHQTHAERDKQTNEQGQRFKHIKHMQKEINKQTNKDRDSNTSNTLINNTPSCTTLDHRHANTHSTSQSRQPQ